MHLVVQTSSGPCRLFLAVNILERTSGVSLYNEIMSLFDDLVAHLPVDSSMAS